MQEYGQQSDDKYNEPQAPTILDIAKAWGAKEDENGGINGGEFERLGLPLLGGCQNCGASIAAYNAYPGRNGFLIGTCCSSGGDEVYQTVEEFEADYPREEQ